MMGLPVDWVNVKLPDVCRMVMGQSPPSSTYNTDGNGIPFFQGKKEFGATFPTVEQYCSAPNKIADKDAILLSIRAPVGPTNVAPQRCCIGRGLAALHPYDGLDQQFLLLYLRSQERTLSGEGGGSTFSAITKKYLCAYTVPLAPVSEQRAIVAKIETLFSELDKGVEQLEQVAEQLKRYRQTVLNAAIEGKLTETWRAQQDCVPSAGDLLGQIRDEQEKRYLQQFPLLRHDVAGHPASADTGKSVNLKPTLALSQNELAGLPRVPQGWAWVRTRDVGDVQLGRQRSPKHHYGEHMRPYLRVANVFEDRIDLSDVLSMNFTPKEYETYRLAHGDILLNEGQSLELVGRPAIFCDELPGACFQNTLVRFRPHNVVLSEYALTVFRAYLHSGRFQRMAKYTVNIAHLGAGRFSQLEFPLPTLAEQKQIVQETESRFSVLDELEKTVEAGLKQADALRQSILKKAFEGRLLSEAELTAVRADPGYEQAEVLLERICAEREQIGTGTKRGRKAKATSLPKVSGPERYKQAAYAAYAVQRLAGRETFGRVQQMKLVNLIPHVLAQESKVYVRREAAGPLDPAIHKIEGLAKRKDWFTTRKVGQRYRYTPGAKIDEAVEFAQDKFGDKADRVDWLLDEFARWDTEEAELKATTFAVWNDYLIDGHKPSETEIVAGVHGWHPEKVAKFPPDRIARCIKWMKKNGLVPMGVGPKTVIVSDGR